MIRFNTPKGRRPSITESGRFQDPRFYDGFNTPKGGRPSDTNELEINENKTLNVSIPRRVEGLPIPKNSPGNSPGEACFNTPKGGRPSDT